MLILFFIILLGILLPPLSCLPPPIHSPSFFSNLHLRVPLPWAPCMPASCRIQPMQSMIRKPEGRVREGSLPPCFWAAVLEVSVCLQLHPCPGSRPPFTTATSVLPRLGQRGVLFLSFGPGLAELYGLHNLHN